MQLRVRIFSDLFSNAATVFLVGINSAHIFCGRAESFGETRCIDRAGERRKCTTDSSWKRKFEISFIWRSVSFGEIQCIVFIWVLCSEALTRRIWEDLCLKTIRITCSIKRGQTWRNKSFMSSPSTSASVNYNDKRKSKYWYIRTHNTDLFSPEENKFDFKKNHLCQVKFSEILRSEISTKWKKLRERKNNEQMKSQCKRSGKITRQFSSSLSNCSECKNRWMLKEFIIVGVDVPALVHVSFALLWDIIMERRSASRLSICPQLSWRVSSRCFQSSWLRLSAPVFYCHREFVTRWRLTLAKEASRDTSYSYWLHIHLDISTRR